MKAELTRRERFCRLCDFEKVDRWPRWESYSFWGETVAEWKVKGGLPPDADAMAYYRFEPRLEIYGGLGFGHALPALAELGQGHPGQEGGVLEILQQDRYPVRQAAGQHPLHPFRGGEDFPAHGR